MRISIEAFAIVNFSMDVLALSLASRWMTPARPRVRRILLSSLAGTVYAFIAMSLRLPGVLDALLFFTLAYAMSSLAIPTMSVRLRLRAAVLFVAALALIGGVCLALSQFFGETILILLPGALAALLMGKNIWQAQKQNAAAKSVTIVCEYAGAQANMRALVDTGNRLVDPVTGFPVIAAPREALAPLLPQTLDPSDLSTLPLGFRLLHAQTAAGPCLFMCFKPDRIMVTYDSYSFGVRAVIAVSGASEGALALMPACLLEPLQGASMHA